MTWTTKNYAEVNQPPVLLPAHAHHLTVKSGTQFHLSAAGTTDHDGGSISYL
ncbi:MAG TPA: hypothetical protein PLA68_06220 [Panacibacter sp.]|nr:hypothetical protein [Panacibacter sp.]